MGLAIAAFAAVGTAAAFGRKGLIILALVLLVAAVGDFWRELVSTEAQLNAAERERDSARAEAAGASESLSEARLEHEQELDAAREQYRKLRTEALRLERENADLKTSAGVSHVSLKKLLSATEAQVQAIERIERARRIVDRLGTHEWPAVSITTGNGVLEVIAYVESGAAELDGEAVALVSKQLGGILARSSARSYSDRQILASFRIDEISRFARRRFSISKDVNPDPFTLRLQGFSETSPLAGMNDDQLALLKNALRELQAAIASALIPSEREDK